MEYEVRLTVKDQEPPRQPEEQKAPSPPSGAEIFGWLVIAAGCVIVTLAQNDVI